MRNELQSKPPHFTSSQTITPKFTELDQMRAREEHTKTTMPLLYHLMYDQLSLGSNNRDFLASGAQTMDVWNNPVDVQIVSHSETDEEDDSEDEMDATLTKEDARHDDDIAYMEEDNLPVLQQNRANLVGSSFFKYDCGVVCWTHLVISGADGNNYLCDGLGYV